MEDILHVLSSTRRQTFFIPNPPLTETNLPDQSGKIVIITGGYAGVGFELSKILYKSNAVIYIAGRSQEKANKAISDIKSACPSSSGRLEFLSVDLQDLNSIKPAVQQFLAKESRLDFLNNNAGVMFPPSGIKSAQNHELQIATNCLGPYLFTKLLTPILKATAERSNPNSVRVAWAGSISIDGVAPKNGVLIDQDGNYKSSNNINIDYGQSKAGNLMLAYEFGLKNPEIVSICYNPGNLRSELTRHLNFVVKFFMENLFMYDSIYGAYTELYSGFSPDLTTADNGQYIAPWGRKDTVRRDITLALKSEEKGGTGTSVKFAAWCEKETIQYASK